MPRSRRPQTDGRKRGLCILLALTPLAAAVVALVALLIVEQPNSSIGVDDAASVRGGVPSGTTTAAPAPEVDSNNWTPTASPTAGARQASKSISNSAVIVPETADAEPTPPLTVAAATTDASSSGDAYRPLVPWEEQVEIGGEDARPATGGGAMASDSASSSSAVAAADRPPSSSPLPRPTISPEPTKASPAPRPTTASPSARPADRPSATPTRSPTPRPTVHPSATPSRRPSEAPSTGNPAPRPTIRPSAGPSRQPSAAPTANPAPRPTTSPSAQPAAPPFSSAPASVSPTARPAMSLEGDFPYELPAFRYREWSALDGTMREIASAGLGYTPTSWNVIGGGFADVENRGWTGLDFEERRAALRLGYVRDTWDCFVNHYGSRTWDRLGGRVANHARALGWTRDLWDGEGRSPSSDDLWWAQLSDAERYAANGLCYFEENWDGVDMNPNPGYFPHPLPEFRYVPWGELSDARRDAARDGLGYVRETWNLPKSNPVESSGTYFDLTPARREAVRDFGFYPQSWNCHINHFDAYYWRGFRGDAKVAVETLGWTVESWDYSSATTPPPASEGRDWDELTPQERGAATALCYFREIWDDVPITEWYDYEGGANTAVSPDGPVPGDIDMSIFRGGTLNL